MAFNRTFVLISIMPALIFFLSCGKNVKGQIHRKPFKQLKNYSFDSNSALAERVAPVPGFLLNEWREYDNRKDYTSYTPDQNEISIIKRSIALLPKKMRALLRERLVGIYFINNLWGNGIADWVIDENMEVYTYLIFNTDALKHDLSGLITSKENTCFIQGNTDINIRVDCGKKYNGFLYILVHEATHAVDYVRKITPYVDPDIKKIQRRVPVSTPFTENIWKDLKTTVRKHAWRKNVTFYGFNGGPKIRLKDAEKIYASFKSSEFVSLYGSLNWAEDLAEMMAFYHISSVLKQPYRIEVYQNNKKVFEYEPLKSEAVRERFKHLDLFY